MPLVFLVKVDWIACWERDLNELKEIKNLIKKLATKGDDIGEKGGGVELCFF